MFEVINAKQMYILQSVIKTKLIIFFQLCTPQHAGRLVQVVQQSLESSADLSNPGTFGSQGKIRRASYI